MTPQQVERVHWRILELIDAARMAMGEGLPVDRARLALDDLRLEVMREIEKLKKHSRRKPGTAKRTDIVAELAKAKGVVRAAR